MYLSKLFFWSILFAVSSQVSVYCFSCSCNGSFCDRLKGFKFPLLSLYDEWVSSFEVLVSINAFILSSGFWSCNMQMVIEKSQWIINLQAKYRINVTCLFCSVFDILIHIISNEQKIFRHSTMLLHRKLHEL